MRQPINVRKIIDDQMTRMGMTKYRLAKLLKKHMPSHNSIYHFLSGQGGIGMENLAHVLDALDLKITPRRVKKADDETGRKSTPPVHDRP